MPDREWSTPALLLVYVSVLGILALVVGYGLTKVTMASDEAARRAEREKTVLKERLESAREIRRALARPVPPPDPLPPITAKPANPPDQPNLAASGVSKEKPRKLKIPATARNAMAMGTRADVPRRIQTHDRGGLNGW